MNIGSPSSCVLLCTSCVLLYIASEGKFSCWPCGRVQAMQMFIQIWAVRRGKTCKFLSSRACIEDIRPIHREEMYPAGTHTHPVPGAVETAGVRLRNPHNPTKFRRKVKIWATHISMKTAAPLITAFTKFTEVCRHAGHRVSRSPVSIFKALPRRSK